MLKKYFTKQFYKTGFKKEKRISTLLYFLITITAFTLVTAPFIIYNVTSFYNTFVSEVDKLPSQMTVSYSKDSGLNTNIKAPAVLNLNNFTIAIDTYSLYKPERKESLVFRNKGLLVYQNKKVTQQRSYESLEIENFSFSIADLKTLIRKVDLESKFSILAVIIFASSILRALVTGLFVAFVFAIVPYATQRDKKTLTYLQNVKLFVYLLPIYFVGLSLAILTLGTLNGLGIISLTIAYFWVRS